MPKLTRYPAGITEVREGRISHQECARLLFCKGHTASVTKKKIKNIIIHLKTFRFILVNKKADSRYPILIKDNSTVFSYSNTVQWKRLLLAVCTNSSPTSLLRTSFIQENLQSKALSLTKEDKWEKCTPQIKRNNTSLQCVLTSRFSSISFANHINIGSLLRG